MADPVSSAQEKMTT